MRGALERLGSASRLMADGGFIMRQKWSKVVLAVLAVTVALAGHAAGEVININTPQFERIVKAKSDGEVRSVRRAWINTSTGRFRIYVTLNRYWCGRWKANITGRVSGESCRLRDLRISVDTGPGCFFLLPGVGIVERLVLFAIEDAIEGEARGEIRNALCKMLN